MTDETDYSDLLRAVGGFLDDADAREVDINDESGHWSVAWDRSGVASFGPDELSALRAIAESRRGLVDDQPQIGLAQLLRVIGQKLDDMDATGFSIAVVPNGFEITAIVGTTRSVNVYTIEELTDLARQQQQRRAR